MFPRQSGRIESPVDVGALRDEVLHGAQVSRPGSFHERRAAALGRVLEVGAVLQEQLGHVRVPVLARVRERRVPRSRLGVHVRTGLQQVAHL